MNKRQQLRAAHAALHSLHMQYNAFPTPQLAAYCDWQHERQQVRHYARELVRVWHNATVPGAGYDPRNSDRGRWLHLAS